MPPRPGNRNSGRAVLFTAKLWPMNGFFDLTLAALRATDADEKCAAVARLSDDRDAGRLQLAPEGPVMQVPEPGRPLQPALVSPRRVPKRSVATREGRAALVHALTHIEFNAINLALDAAYRFRGLPADYYGDWLQVAAEEARHFLLLRGHLRTLGFDYGDFSAHDGLWDMARKTAHDALARMALVPRVLEARGLDATPGIREKLLAAGDNEAARILDIIERDEIGHVAVGSRWFRYLCAQRGVEPEVTFARLWLEYDAPRALPPLNVAARRAAGFSAGELAWLELGSGPSKPV